MIFVNTITTCTICQKREPEEGRIKCGYCKDRFDQHAKPYIIYSDIIAFIKGHQRCYAWYIDGRVAHVSSPRWSHMLGMDRETLISTMKTQGFTYNYTDKASCQEITENIHLTN